MWIKAVIDRIVDGKTAVMHVGNEEREMHYPADKLPAGAKEGSWLQVQVVGDEITTIQVDESLTEDVDRRFSTVGKLGLKSREVSVWRLKSRLGR